MSEMEVDDIKNNIYNSLLKNKTKEMAADDPNKSKRVVFQEKPIILNTVSQKASETIAKPDSSEGDKGKEKKERNRPPTKVVVRRLPPTMTLETFIDNVSPLPDHDFIYLVQADTSLGTNAFSRAYINFVNMEDLLTFYEQFDNYVFMDNKGNEYPAVVEFAPFQRVPKKRSSRRKDPKAGTLKDDPAFISFVESLKEKKDTSSMKQASAEHLLALTSENATKKDVTTPLLEFVKQRRAERQRMREEKREERKRKELERKRVKEEERKRRKDNDSVLKVLRNPEHEDKTEASKLIKDRDRNLLIMKKREEERKMKEKDRKERRDIKTRDTVPKSFRDERQKQPDGRLPRKTIEDQRRKPIPERGPSQNKLNDTRHNSEYTYNKETENRKIGVPSRDTEQKKGTSDKLVSYSKESERSVREVDARKSFKESDVKRSEKYVGYGRDTDYRRSYGNERKVIHSYSESDTRKKLPEAKTSFKVNDTVSERKSDTNKSQNPEEVEIKKWELLGAKPKRKVSRSNECEQLDEIDKIVDENKEIMNEPLLDDVQTNKPDFDPVNDADNITPEEAPGVVMKRRSSLEYEKQTDRNFSGKPKRQISLDSEMFLKDTNPENSCKRLSKSQEFETTANMFVRISRRNSLDSGDHKENMQTEYTNSSKLCTEKKRECEMNSMCKYELSNKEIFGVGRCDKETADEQRILEIQKPTAKSDEQKSLDSDKTEDSKSTTSGPKLDGISDSTIDSNKRDPRAERRIRNKDRPSIEIYRPGMGRLSIQRKEREKNVGIGSSTEQDSPSNSPSPTPSSRLLNNTKISKGNQELRSMTFKRSVSREK